MKFKIFILSLFMLLLAGCAEQKTKLQPPTSQNPTKITLPSVIIFNGEIFSKQNENNSGAEYYLKNEQGYKWSKLITILFSPNIKNIDDYINAIQKMHRQNKQLMAHYEILRLNDTRSFQTEIYYPVKGNENFSSYEINYNLSNIQKCGLVSVTYAQRYNALSDPKGLKLIMEENVLNFFKQVPKISC